MTIKRLLISAIAAVGVSLTAHAQPTELSIMAPAAPGGGWDQTARSMQQAFTEAGLVSNVQVTNVPGAGGTIGLAQFVNSGAGNPNNLIVGGYVMVGAIIANKSPVTLAEVTPLARLTGEYEAIVVPAASDIKTIGELVEKLKADPGAVSWAGGSAGGVDHIVVGQIAAAAGVDPTKINYIPFSGGGEALAAILGGQVTAGVSGTGEWQSQIQSGELRLLAVTSPGTPGGLRRPDSQGERPRGGDAELAHGRRSPGYQRRRQGHAGRHCSEDVAVRRVEEHRDAEGLARHLPRWPGLPSLPQFRDRKDHRDPEAARHRPVTDGDSAASLERRPDWPVRVIALLLIMAGAIVAWDAVHMRRGVAAYSRIGPRAFPYAIAAGLVLLRTMHCVWRSRRDLAEPREHDELTPIAWIIGGLDRAIALLRFAGFSIATGAVFAGTARAFGRGPLWFNYLGRTRDVAGDMAVLQHGPEACHCPRVRSRRPHHAP